MKPSKQKDLYAEKALKFFQKLQIEEKLTVLDIELTLTQPILDLETLSKVDMFLKRNLKTKEFIFEQSQKLSQGNVNTDHKDDIETTM